MKKTPQTPKPEFRTAAYQWTYGRSPRGRGGWAFQATDSLTSGRGYGKVVFVPDATFAEAKRQVVAQLTAANGRKPAYVEVLP